MLISLLLLIPISSIATRNIVSELSKIILRLISFLASTIGTKYSKVWCTVDRLVLNYLFTVTIYIINIVFVLYYWNDGWEVEIDSMLWEWGWQLKEDKVLVQSSEQTVQCYKAE